MNHSTGVAAMHTASGIQSGMMMHFSMPGSWAGSTRGRTKPGSNVEPTSLFNWKQPMRLLLPGGWATSHSMQPWLSTAWCGRVAPGVMSTLVVE